jgi:hypothetical protein
MKWKRDHASPKYQRRIFPLSEFREESFVGPCKSAAWCLAEMYEGSCEEGKRMGGAVDAE